MIRKIAPFLSDRKTYISLLSLNIFSAIVVFYYFRNSFSGDEYSYTSLAEGILKGRYSMWHFLQDYVPDTLRNPGYPMLLAIVRFFSDGIIAVKLLQLAFYLSAAGLVLNILRKINPSYLPRVLFLTILLPSFQLVVFTTMILPESLMTFLVALYIWMCMHGKSNTVGWSVLTGILCGIMFQVRPVFLFFPFIRFFLEIFFKKEKFILRNQVILIAVYLISMVPYGIWNQQHNGKFKVTSLEGGGGVFYFGYWSFKMPGYVDTNYWIGNFMNKEPVSFVTPAEAAANYAAFNDEWTGIENQLAPYLTAADSAHIKIMGQEKYSKLPMTLSPEYTAKREELLKKITWDHYRDDPWFFIKTRMYTAVRLWFTSYPTGHMENKNASAKMILLYPFLVSFIAFVLFLFTVPIAVIKKKIYGYPILLLLSVMLYFGIIYIPFAIQARYTIPVRMEMYALTALAVSGLVQRKQERSSKM